MMVVMVVMVAARRTHLIALRLIRLGGLKHWTVDVCVRPVHDVSGVRLRRNVRIIHDEGGEDCNDSVSIGVEVTTQERMINQIHKLKHALKQQQQ